MSIRTAQALRDLQNAQVREARAKADPRVNAEEYRLSVRETQLRKSIFDSLNRQEPATAADHAKLPKRTETLEQQRSRRRGEALIEARRRQQRAQTQKREQSNPLFLNPRYETSDR